MDHTEEVLDVIFPSGDRAEGAEPQSLIKVAPLDNGNGAIAAVFASSLNVSFEIAVEPRPYIDASARETQCQIRFDKRPEMQRHKATEKMNAHLPLSCSLRNNL